jgi:hypothetical protein
VITRQWWETDRKKYMDLSEVVEAECGRGDTKSPSRRRELLGEVSLPLDERMSRQQHDRTGCESSAG